MLFQNFLSSLLADRRVDGQLTFCCFELVLVRLQEETSASETDMKLLVLVLEKVGKEPTDWKAECLWFLPVVYCGKAEGLTMDEFEEAADWLCPKLFATP